MPFKANADRRQHIAKQQYRATNSAVYDAALRQRGSLTVWFTEEAIAAWKANLRTEWTDDVPMTLPLPVKRSLQSSRPPTTPVNNGG